MISLLMMASMTYAQKPSGYNLKQGDKFTMTRVTDVATKQQAMGQSTEISEITTVVEALEVIAVSNNVYTIKSTPTKRKLAISAPMMSQEMNSDLDGNQNLPFNVLRD